MAQTSRAVVLGTMALALQRGAAGGVAELRVLPSTVGGLFVARVEVGTPPQAFLAQIDTASEWLWLPNATGMGGGFSAENSSTAKVGGAKSLVFADGLTVKGNIVRETVRLGGAGASVEVPLLLAWNVSGPAAPPRGVGLLGLICSRGAGRPGRQGPGAAQQGSFFDAFWSQHAGVPRFYTLDLGGPEPRVLLGEEAGDESDRQGGVQFLATTFTRRSSLWYTSVRAVGLSWERTLAWNLDFNSVAPYGAPALLDSGSAAIRVGSGIYHRLLRALPGGCRADPKTGGTRCACDERALDEQFPWISVSFESIGAFRFLGLDSGGDAIVCIPPRAYVHRSDDEKACSVALVDGGGRHLIEGYEAIVLGVPFFRSAVVALDADGQRVGVGAARAHRGGSGSAGEDRAKGGCPCADPKNWWATGKRLSLGRVAAVLLGVAVLAAYIFVMHSASPLAEQLRSLPGAICRGASGAGGQTLVGGGASARSAISLRMPPSDDRPFVQMGSSGRGASE